MCLGVVRTTRIAPDHFPFFIHMCKLSASRAGFSLGRGNEETAISWCYIEPELESVN